MKIFKETLLITLVGLLNFKSAGGISGFVPLPATFLDVTMTDETTYHGVPDDYPHDEVPVWLQTDQLHLPEHHVYIRTPFFENFRSAIVAPHPLPNHDHAIHTPSRVRIRIRGNEYYSGNEFHDYHVAQHQHHSAYQNIIQANLPAENHIYVYAPGNRVFSSPLVPHW